MSIACSCVECVHGCRAGSPGWFLPGEAERAAALLGMPFGKFLNTYLIIDFWVGLDEYGIYSPLKDIGHHPLHSDKMSDELGFIRDLEGRTRGVPGQKVSWGYGMLPGRCVFLDEKDRCKIHAAKPFECRESHHDPKLQKKYPGKGIRYYIAKQWVQFYKRLDVAKAKGYKKWSPATIDAAPGGARV